MAKKSKGNDSDDSDSRPKKKALPKGKAKPPAKANGRAATRGASGVHPVAAVLERTTQVVSRYQLQRALSSLPPGIELHLVRIGAETGGGALEFEKASQWIEQGYAATRAYLDRARERMALEAASPA